jgi:hypothetical protein
MFMISRITMGAIAGAALAFAASAGAQTPPPTNEASGLPYCSAKVKDRCIQKSDIRREKAAAAKAG